MSNDSHAEPADAPRWQPIPSHQRRVLGVLIEKAITTPDAYPLTLNALRVGCNQKSNRHPLLELDEADVEEALEKLRQLGAATEMFGSGRVARFRHQAYDWLGVTKIEMAILAELLLRGAQTEGELRGRASRFEPIADLPALRTHLAALQARGLVISLTPEGRGHMISHGLYLPREIDKVRAEAGAAALHSQSHAADEAEPPNCPPPASAAARPAAATSGALRGDFDALEREVHSLRGQVAELRQALEEVTGIVERSRQELAELRSSLGG